MLPSCAECSVDGGIAHLPPSYGFGADEVRGDGCIEKVGDWEVKRQRKKQVVRAAAGVR